MTTRQKIDGLWSGTSHGLMLVAGFMWRDGSSSWVIWLTIGVAMMVTRVVLPYGD